jgi:hypothetical protein
MSKKQIHSNNIITLREIKHSKYYIQAEELEQVIDISLPDERDYIYAQVVNVLLEWNDIFDYMVLENKI